MFSNKVLCSIIKRTYSKRKKALGPIMRHSYKFVSDTENKIKMLMEWVEVEYRFSSLFLFTRALSRLYQPRSKNIKMSRHGSASSSKSYKWERCLSVLDIHFQLMMMNVIWITYFRLLFLLSLPNTTPFSMLTSPLEHTYWDGWCRGQCWLIPYELWFWEFS
jgi:hypothetical protein